MRRPVLPMLLAAAIALAPSQARADDSGLGALAEALAVALVVGSVVVGTVEVLTGVATYKNYRSASRHQDPSAGWVGVGAVGGVLNLGGGAALFVYGLPTSHEVGCGRFPGEPGFSASASPREPVKPPQERLPGEGAVSPSPGTCTYRTPAKVGSILVGTLAFGAGAFALGSAIAAAGSGPGGAPARTTSPGAAPAVGLVLPALRF